MKTDAIYLEELRLQETQRIEDYPDFHERHRVIPAIFENRQHRSIFDVAAGVGCAARRIQENYPADLLCNDITPKCLNILKQMGIPTVSFDLDVEQPYPFPDGRFDAVISFATIEHLMHVERFVREARRILSADGYFYISSPNYAGLAYLPRLVINGRTFHNPLSPSSRQRYEFYAHIRYFTYRTLLEFVSSFGFTLDTVYLPLPEGSARYRALAEKSKLAAFSFRFAMNALYRLFSPRWASEPILCFRKSDGAPPNKVRKVIL